jgi:hypothetical protein
MMEIPYQTEDPNYFPCIESITAATFGEVFNRVTAKIFRRFSIVVECLACPEREHQTIGGPFDHPLYGQRFRAFTTQRPHATCQTIVSSKAAVIRLSELKIKI